MKAKELIALLSQFPEREVITYDDFSGDVSRIVSVGDSSSDIDQTVIWLAIEWWREAPTPTFVPIGWIPAKEQ